MRWRPWMWLSLSMACFLAALYFWRLGDRWAAQKAAVPAAHGTHPIQPGGPPIKPAAHSQTSPLRLLSDAGHVHSLPARGADKTNQVSRLTHRLTNTTKTLASLAHSDKAILLENALIDTEKNGAPAIPNSLRSQGDPGSYIVQARGPTSDSFRALLKTAGAAVVAYVPNNAYLVRGSEAVARQLQADPQTQTVLPFEPYYKL